VDVSATAVAMPMIGETRINLMQHTFLFFADGLVTRFRVTGPKCVTRLERGYGLRAAGAWAAL